MSLDGKNRVLRFKYGNLCPISIKNDTERAIIIVGHPALNNKIDIKSFISNYIESVKKNKSDVVSSVDGEFLIIDFNKITLKKTLNHTYMLHAIYSAVCCVFCVVC